MDQFDTSRLSGSIQALKADFGLHPVTAAELEFYVSDVPDMAAFWKRVKTACDTCSVGLQKCEAERGQGQFEIALSVAEPMKTIGDLYAIRKIISDTAQDFGGKADFSARPREGQPGSGLHIHLHLADAQGKNMFHKNDDAISDSLKFSIGGLLANLQKDMKIFAPHPDSRKRFVPGGNVPVTVSWGANNRTVAVRLPDKPHSNKHLEHRVSGADADPCEVMIAILEAVHDGISHRVDPGPQVYGDASLAMYGLPKLLAES